MEDNEFEEVTIISHTDHGTSVLPQSTAERLMKEIKLEVTQKISQNENVKLGSLEGSTTPTLLDAIHQNVLSQQTHPELGGLERTVWFFSKEFPQGSKQTQKYFLSIGQECLMTQLEQSVPAVKLEVPPENASTFGGDHLINNVMLWGEYLLVFPMCASVFVFTPEGQFLKGLPVQYGIFPGWFVWRTRTKVYFKDNDGGI